MLKTHAVEKLARIHSSWLLLKKNKGRLSSAAQQARQIEFTTQLDCLFDTAVIILGSPPKTIHWRSPGPVHHARRMAKLLYAMKIMLFRDQRDVFQLTKAEEARLERFVLFGALLYSKSWTEAPLASEAPAGDCRCGLISRNTTRLIQKLVRLQGLFLSVICSIYQTKLLVWLALFSIQVTSEDKELLVSNLSIELASREKTAMRCTLTEGSSAPRRFCHHSNIWHLQSTDNGQFNPFTSPWPMERCWNIPGSQVSHSAAASC